MSLEKMTCGVNYTTNLLRDNINELIDAQGSLTATESAEALLNSEQLKVAMDNAGKTPAEVVAGTAAGQAGAAVLNYGYFADKTGYVRLSDGGISVDDNWLYSDLYRIEAGEVIVMNLYAVASVAALAFYDEDSNYMSGVASTSSDQEVTVPEGATHFRVSRGNPDTFSSAEGKTIKANVTKQLLDIPKLELDVDNIKSLNLGVQSNFFDLHVTNNYPRKINLSGTKKTILYGDSISSSSYPWAGERMAELTGGQVYAAGAPGGTMFGLAAQSVLDRIFTYDPDLIVIFLGGNDSGEPDTVGTFSGYVKDEPVVPEVDISGVYNGSYNVQAVDYIVRKVQDYYYDIRARANLTGSETEEEKTAKIDALVMPQIVLCTPIPQKRYTDNHVYSQPLNWKRKRDGVIEVARKNNVHCVDLFTMWGQNIDMSMEPFWETPTDTTTNNGIYTMDGLHPNKWGSRLWVELVAASIGI